MKRVGGYLPKNLLDRAYVPDNIAGYAIGRNSKNPEHGMKEYLRVHHDGSTSWVGDIQGATAVNHLGGYVADSVAHFMGHGAVSVAILMGGREPEPVTNRDMGAPTEDFL